MKSEGENGLRVRDSDFMQSTYFDNQERSH